MQVRSYNVYGKYLPGNSQSNCENLSNAGLIKKKSVAGARTHYDCNNVELLKCHGT